MSHVYMVFFVSLAGVRAGTDEFARRAIIPDGRGLGFVLVSLFSESSLICFYNVRRIMGVILSSSTRPCLNPVQSKSPQLPPFERTCAGGSPSTTNNSNIDIHNTNNTTNDTTSTTTTTANTTNTNTNTNTITITITITITSRLLVSSRLPASPLRGCTPRPKGRRGCSTHSSTERSRTVFCKIHVREDEEGAVEVESHLPPNKIRPFGP